MPTVSVVIPTFNRSNLLLDALESVLSQTYKPHEIIVVDDGSTDDTAERLRPFLGRVRYFHQKNRGASAAQNKGIRLAGGQLISILASDDFWLPTKLEQQVKTMDALGREFGACFTDCSFFGNPKWNRSAFELSGLTCVTDVCPLLDPLKYILGRYAAIYVQSLIFRKSLFEEIGGFDEGLVVSEDTDFLFRLTFKTKFCFVARPLVKINRTEGQERLMNLFAIRDERMFCSRERVFNKWLSLPEPLEGTTSRQIWQFLRNLYEDWIIAKLYQMRFNEAYYKARKHRKAGGSFGRLFVTLVFRASRKLYSTLRGPGKA